MTDRLDELVVALVRRPFGKDGVLRLESLSGEYSHLKRCDRLVLRQRGERRSVAVVSFREMNGFAAVQFEGIESMEQARLLVGSEVLMKRNQLIPCAPNEYYYADLCGLDVIAGGAEVGTVSDLLETDSALYLEVRLEAGEKRLVPFQAEFVGEVDLTRGWLEITDAEVLA